jgi:hypothetical protein
LAPPHCVHMGRAVCLSVVHAVARAVLVWPVSMFCCQLSLSLSAVVWEGSHDILQGMIRYVGTVLYRCCISHFQLHRNCRTTVWPQLGGRSWPRQEPCATKAKGASLKTRLTRQGFVMFCFRVLLWHGWCSSSPVDPCYSFVLICWPLG